MTSEDPAPASHESHLEAHLEVGWRKIEIIKGNLEPMYTSGWWEVSASLSMSSTVLLLTLSRGVIPSA